MALISSKLFPILLLISVLVYHAETQGKKPVRFVVLFKKMPAKRPISGLVPQRESTAAHGLGQQKVRITVQWQ